MVNYFLFKNYNGREMNRNKFNELLTEAFNGCYFCSRVWSAWSYGTMAQEDFCLFSEDEDFSNGFYELVMKKGNKLSIDDIEVYCDSFDGYYNKDIEDNFINLCFHENYLDFVDLEEFLEELKV